MSLDNAPGKWLWRYQRGAWWRIHPELNIQSGPYNLRDAIRIVRKKAR